MWSSHTGISRTSVALLWLVQASIASCDQAPGIEHFACKYEVEKSIDDLDLPRTFVRTVFFMDNFTDPKTEKMMFPVLTGALRPDLRLHMVATGDVGRLVADAFEDPGTYLGRAVDIARDAITVGEMKAAFERVTGRSPPWWRMPRWILRIANPDMARQLVWNHSPGWTFSIESVREVQPTVASFEDFLHRHRLELLGR